MADDASYMAFLHKANDTTGLSSSSSQKTASLDEPQKSNHPFLPLLNNKLANLSSKTFITETDSDFYAIFIASSALPSWSETMDVFPNAADLEGQVDGVLFSETLADVTKRYPDCVSAERIIFMRGKVDRRRETPSGSASPACVRPMLVRSVNIN